ncbi:DUF1016 domain-containing protein [Marinomonas sp. M1K-6]|uniref:DUF1016 domain-containing protein n=1 Tax=Marinomonas profundi TaxID=2726122 RepID=A0A847R6X9_9GAMM|nr:PDDEXK nuclease domain-containing protein [Marinomonas profundi]NLQ16857.1 DUF1016 domain-containing protein [Marinomonas profundi]UDV02588.1 DUF1016 family protein [Marinomonas profundi]
MGANNTLPDVLYGQIANLLQQARLQVKKTINHQMVSTYWEIGHLIVEHEQQGQARAEYGKQQLQQLSKRLTDEFGKGFDVTNLRFMRQFYLAFPKRDAVRRELSWTHHRILMNMYVRMYEEQKRASDDNPTIGLILCSERNNTVAKYSVLNESKQLFASKYVTALPTEEELQQELEREREHILRIQEQRAAYQSTSA